VALKLPRINRRTAVIACVLLALVVAIVAFRVWDRGVEDRVGRWAEAEVDRRTGGVYRLRVSDVTFLPFDGTLAFDSAVVVTDTARNRRRHEPLPLLQWGSHGCRVTGVDAVRLLLRRTFVARELGCDRVSTSITLVASGDPRERADSAKEEALAALPRSLGLSSVRITRVSLPEIHFVLRRPGTDGGSSVVLDRARFEAADIVFDPARTREQGGRLTARRAGLIADGFVLRPDSNTRIMVAGLAADFSDSTLRLVRVRHEPEISEDEWVRRVRVRRDRIRFDADSLRGRGVAFRAFLATGDIGTRVLEVDGARLDVLTDRRIPMGPPRRHRTPQQVAADPASALGIDTLVVRGAAITYRERKPGSERPGRASFESVHGRVVHLHLPSRGKPLRIEAEARVMGEGRLVARAEVPLDADDFRYRLSATLGRMPAGVFNRFLSSNEAFEFGDGQIDSITIEQTARRGVATTVITPRYHDLSVDPTGEGGGPIGSVSRAVKKFVANAFVVRSRNPGEDGKDLRTVRTVRPYDPTKTWVQFLWLSLRDGLMEGIKE
jgi:hypothetical protein